MPATATHLRLDGYTDSAAVDDAFASSLVDVAYIDEITPEAIFVLPDQAGSIDLDNPKDVEWLTDVIVTTLAEYGQSGVRLTLVRKQA